MIEYLFRGYTHWSMVLTGGACLLTFYFYTEEFKDTPTLAKAAVGALIFTGFEFAVGIVVNVEDGFVNTIEGNSSNKVQRGRYATGDSTIYGYGGVAY